MSKHRICFIINPHSGIGMHQQFESMVESTLDPLHYQYQFHYTQFPQHAFQLAQDALDHSDFIVAVGGDGTVNDVARALIKTSIPLGIIPLGSGNGLARHLGISTNPQQALKQLVSAQTINIDTASANGIPFFSIAGLGFDATIAQLIINARIRGFWAYFFLCLREYFFYKPKTYTIHIDGQKQRRTALFISIANGSQFGYGISIAPEAKITDGLLDMVVVQKPSFFQSALTVFHVLNKDTADSHLEHFRANVIKVTQKKPYPINIDGEAVNVGRKIRFKIHPKTLRVLVPKDHSSHA